jgi:hypothetical protein
MDFKKYLPHLIAILVFISLVLVYFNPIIEGKIIVQGDILQSRGMSKFITDYRAANGEEALWIPTMFSGMPSFQTSIEYPSNIIGHIDKLITFGIPHPFGMLATMMLGMYILLLALNVNPKIAAIGAFAVAFSTFMIIGLEAGHNAKIKAIAYVAPVIAGVLLSFRGKLITGLPLTAIALGLMINCNHIQITYYLIFILLFVGIFEFVHYLKEKKTLEFFKISIFLVLAAILGAGTNVSRLWSTYDYGKETIRGAVSELTQEDGSKKQGGLDKDYAFNWSNSMFETLNLLIPNSTGGSSGEALDENSNVYKTFIKLGVPKNQASNIVKQLPTYWGEQPFTSGPYYSGAIIVFLFVLGLFLVDGRMKWWILAMTILSLMLSWGKNFESFNYWFFDNIPFYNKFRAPTMVIGIISIMLPLLGMLGLQKIYNKEFDKSKFQKQLIYSVGIVGGICLFFMLFAGSLFNFTSSSDLRLEQAGWPAQAVDALMKDRKDMFFNDSFRSLFLVLLAAGTIYLFYIDKLKKELLVGLIAAGVFFDIWTVDKRYLNNDSFQAKNSYEKYFIPTQADQTILQDNDPHFRVVNLSVNTFNDASTSYHHRSIGGYHPAKLALYQDVIEKHLSKNNMQVLSMLDTRYFIVPDKESGGKVAQRNPNAFGAAWFVREAIEVANADEEIEKLNELNLKQQLVYDARFKNYFSDYKIDFDENAKIKLVTYEPSYIKYESSAATNQLAVMSDIFYSGNNHWKAYLNGQETEFARVNYLLRGIKVPSGNNTIEFRYTPTPYILGEKISLAFSFILILAVGGAAVIGFKKKK